MAIKFDPLKKSVPETDFLSQIIKLKKTQIDKLVDGRQQKKHQKQKIIFSPSNSKLFNNL